MREIIMKEMPYLADMVKRVFIITPEEFAELDKGPQYVYNNTKEEGKDKSFNKDLIRRILNDDYAFSVAMFSCASDQNCMFKVMYLVRGDVAGNKYIPIREVVNYLSTLEDLSEIEKNRLEELKQKLSIESVESENNIYTTTIDGKEITIKSKDLLSLLDMTDEEFIKFSTSDSPLPNISREEYAYMLNDYVEKSSMLNRLDKDSKEYIRISTMISLNHTDYESLNKLSSIEDDNLPKVKLNPLLVNEIMKGLPDDYDDLHKAAYIYLKMCSVLSYDPDFYIMDQKGAIAEIHKDIERLSKITPRNNLIVCYEFNEIYGKLLSEMGINYNNRNSATDEYGSGHAYLNCRIGKYLLDVDSVTSILAGDLVNVKIPAKVDGFRCTNTNKKSQAEVTQALKEAYSLLIDQIEEKEDEVGFDTDDLIRVYEQSKKNEWIKAGFKEKVDNFFTLIVESGLTGIDALGYLLHLKKQIFSENELKDNISIQIFKHRSIDEKSATKLRVAPVLLITLNNITVSSGKSNTYMHYEPPAVFREISREELREKIDSGEYSYFGSKQKPIPGLFEESYYGR